MKSVNLVPVESRRGGAPPVAVYGLLGGLTVVLLAVTLLVVTSNKVHDRQGALTEATTAATQADAQATRLAPYTNFVAMQQKRVATVRSLASTRFAWSRAFADVSHVVGRTVWLTGLTGTVASGVTIDNSNTGSAQTLRQANPNPALEIAGCAKSNLDVARLMSRLRAMRGVADVTLADAIKQDDATPPSKRDNSDASCGSPKAPDFHAVVFYAPLRAPSASTSVPSTATAAATVAPTTSTTSTTSTTPSDGSSASDASSTGATP